jgi:site-specific recombinase XerD
MKADNLNLRNVIESFRLCCQTEGKSPKTVEWYAGFLKRFGEFLKRNKLPGDLSRIGKNHIREFIYYLQTEARTPRTGNPLSQATVQGYVRTLKAFFSWAMREEYVQSNPMIKIPIPKAGIRIVNTFSNEQISKLASECRRANGAGYRNLAIILLLLDSGIRVSELVSIELNDVDIAEGCIKVRRAKGNRERIVPIGSLVQRSLWRYINYHRPQPITQRITRLFLTDNGLPLTKSGVQQMLRRIGKRAGIIGVRCSPHTFRHTFAKNYLLNGGDIFSLQRILGHSSLASVRIYPNLFAGDIKRQHQRFSPVDNMVENRTMHPLTYWTTHSTHYNKIS